MSTVPTDPMPGQVPPIPPVTDPVSPIGEPQPDRLPDEEPNPNPDESDAPPLSVQDSV